MMNLEGFLKIFAQGKALQSLLPELKKARDIPIFLEGLSGSTKAVVGAIGAKNVHKPHLFVLRDKESAAYFFNDLENLLGENGKKYEERRSFFFPSSLKKPFSSLEKDNAASLLRAEVMNRLVSPDGNMVVVTYPEAIFEKIISRKLLKKNLLSVSKGEEVSVDFLMEMLVDYGFERADFVVEPGQFSIRGGIVDVFSFSNDYPYRIEVMADLVESLRSFNPSSQLSIRSYENIDILPGLDSIEEGPRDLLADAMPANTLLWLEDSAWCMESIAMALEEHHLDPLVYASLKEIAETFLKKQLIEFNKPYFSKEERRTIPFNTSPQPNFNKHFELLADNLKENSAHSIRNIIFFDTPKQVVRIEHIFESIASQNQDGVHFEYDSILLGLHEGFIDHDLKLACYTDHQIFDRYHRYRIRDKFSGKEALSIKSLYNLKPGDYVAHIDHGVGVFSGLEKIEVNGKLQEAIRLIYKNNDILYVSIHSLHRISRYSGKEGSIPKLHRLGSNAWNKLKDKTKKKVKDIATDLIRLYAQRRAKKGHAFSPDGYLQHELEASFLFEDTPDQEKSSADVKKDMESPYPMDRLICGDVGFGKTEVAIRAAFKAVNDSKQVAVLVPTTILALQHYHTFSDRLRDFPVNVDYISRFRNPRERKKALEGAAGGHVDILIGTHRLLGKDIAFKDLGLLIIDEEQKFGVSAKEKLKQLRVNVDTLTLTATPIPRTLQFSLMGARDLSFIHTPPPNRYPIITELHVFNEGLIREAIMYEVSRGGQVFFVHNRVQNIHEVATIIQRSCPDVKIAVGHGQLDGNQLEGIMVDFIHGDYDVLVSTTIIESGLDIPNANTIIINNAHHFGLSDLHQMRGRVGRTNKKAFCYLMSPPMSTLTDEARKRLRAIEEFSELGSGFNIAMRDLDIRGAGNLLGAEQSGFISEIGFETYHKILDEAIAELKDGEFKDLFQGDEARSRESAADCQLETDMELMIPSDYVSNIEERLQLYKELDGLTREEELKGFEAGMRDRFGPLPSQVSGLFDAVRVRWIAQKAGFEKLILKSGKMIGQLPGSEKKDYYQSERFGQILQYAQLFPRNCQIKHNENRISVLFNKVNSIHLACKILREISEIH